MSETDLITTATTTYEYDDEGYLLKEVTITEVTERTDPGDRAIPDKPKSYPWQYPITVGDVSPYGGPATVQSSDTFAAVYNLHKDTREAKERMDNGYF